ncbi:hypothetical protein N8071_00735 [bacterium]|nr:hypothetical protein [bacterium]
MPSERAVEEGTNPSPHPCPVSRQPVLGGASVIFDEVKIRDGGAVQGEEEGCNLGSGPVTIREMPDDRLEPKDTKPSAISNVVFQAENNLFKLTVRPPKTLLLYNN